MQIESDPDPARVEALTDRGRTAAEAALDAARNNQKLFSHHEAKHQNEVRDSYVEIDAPLELYALTRLLRPRHTVEVGVSSGVSSAYLLQGLERNGSGTLHSIDRPSHERPGGARPPRASWSLPPGRCPGWAVPDALRARWDLRIGDKRVVLPLLAAELPRIDLLVYDVPHEDRLTGRELRQLEPRFRAGTVAIVDHGPGGGSCGALKSWSRRYGPRTVRRRGLGLSGLRWIVPTPVTRPALRT